MESALLSDERMAAGIQVTSLSVARLGQPAAHPLSHTAEIRMIFFDTIDFFYATLNQIFVKIKEIFKVHWRLYTEFELLKPSSELSVNG